MMTKPKVLASLSILGMALVGCSSEPTESPAPTETSTASETSQLEKFYATPEGSQYSGLVTNVERIVNSNTGYVVHVVTVNKNEYAVEACQVYQSVMETGQDQINVNNALNESLASTTGDPETCTWE